MVSILSKSDLETKGFMRTDAVRQVFEENFSQWGEIGASVSVWIEGKEVLGLGGGFQDREQTVPWDESTPVLVWSATKGLSAACLLHALSCGKGGVIC
jgi:CubicO group peptidase (beta-lactamase class C family)